MLKSLLASLGFVTVDLKPGQTFASHQVTLFKDGVAGEPVTTADASVSFENLEPGTYKCSAVSLDGAGNPLAPAVESNEVVIAPDTASAVGTITLSLAAPAPAPASPAA